MASIAEHQGAGTRGPRGPSLRTCFQKRQGDPVPGAAFVHILCGPGKRSSLETTLWREARSTSQQEAPGERAHRPPGSRPRCGADFRGPCQASRAPWHSELTGGFRDRVWRELCRQAGDTEPAHPVIAAQGRPPGRVHSGQLPGPGQLLVSRVPWRQRRDGGPVSKPQLKGPARQTAHVCKSDRATEKGHAFSTALPT